MSYCDYCGMSYILVTCEECGEGSEACGCNPSQTICDECDLEGLDKYELQDIIRDLRRELRETEMGTDEMVVASGGA